MVARLQQMISLGLLAGAGFAFWLLQEVSVVMACAAAALTIGAYGLLVALEFVVLRLAPPDAILPRPTARQVLRAWAGEIRHGLPTFFWRQPFRSQAIPDHVPKGGGCGIVFVHGLFCNRGFWSPWMLEARHRGIPFVAVELMPMTGSIDHYIPIVDAAVARLQQATQQPPILVCHSMGGLAARAWIASEPEATARIKRIITIGTPHAGTWLGRFGHGLNARQMRLQSEWLKELTRKEHNSRHHLFTCWFSNADNIVFPALNATLPGADNRWLTGVAHVAMAYHPQVIRDTLAQLAD